MRHLTSESVPFLIPTHFYEYFNAQYSYKKNKHPYFNNTFNLSAYKISNKYEILFGYFYGAQEKIANGERKNFRTIKSHF